MGDCKRKAGTKMLLPKKLLLSILCIMLVVFLFGCGESKQKPEKLSHQEAIKYAEIYAKSSGCISAVSRVHPNFYWSSSPYCTNCVLASSGETYVCVIEGRAGCTLKNGESKKFNSFTMIVDVDAYTGRCSSTDENK